MKKYIHAYIVEGQTLYTAKNSWSDSDLGGNDPLIITDNLSESGYENISSIQIWDKYGNNEQEKREQIKILFEETDWNSISLEDKKIVAKYFLVDESLRDEVLTQQEQDSFNIHKIVYDVNSDIKDFRYINYKIDLRSGISYTPVFHIHSSGTYSGLLEKTEYYKDYVDNNNKGELILSVEEDYIVDDSDLTKPYTARAVLSRSKTWKWTMCDGTLDEVNIKSKNKIYDTRRKQKIEAERRRNNVIEQLIDHVGLAGILSGAFSDIDEAYDSLTELQELHAKSFVGWISSGRGSLIDVIQTDSTTTWLDTTIPDTPQTQAMCPWMIGLTFRSYIQDKLKGNIK